MERWKEAAEAYEKSVRLKPTEINSWLLGMAYLKLQRWPEGAEALKQAARLNPKNTSVHALLGRAYMKMGNRSAALEEHRILQTLDPKKAKELWDFIHK
jgi:cytochrome c-type biogenesis protein CcmH/NrfG